MKKLLLAGLCLLIALSTGQLNALGQSADTSADKTPPSYDMKAQSLVDLERVQKKFADLANAVPADKLAWRPRPTLAPLLKSSSTSPESVTEF